MKTLPGLANVDSTNQAEPFIQLAQGMCVVSSRPWSRPGGKAGPTPPDRTDPIPIGLPGKSGVAEIKEALTFIELAPYVSASHVNMLLNACRQDYINGQFADALNRLIWLKAILTAILQLPDNSKPPESDLQRYRSQASVVDALILQLNLGFDYYAQPLNHVPLVSIGYYRSVLKELLSYGTAIETSYLAYQKAAKDQTTAAGAFHDAMAQALQSVNQMQEQSAQLVAQQGPLSQTIERLSDALNGIWVELMGAETRFKEAVARQAQGCDFAQIAAIGASVASLIATGGAAAPAIGLALAAAKKEPLHYDDKSPVLDDFKGFKYKVNTIAVAGKDIGSFADAFSKVKDALKTQPVPGSDIPGLPGDEAKIVASADDIEAQLKPFLAMDEAREYASLIRSFVTTSEARNNKILEYNNIVVNWQKQQATIAQTQLEADAAQTAYASTQNPFIADAANFMHKVWIESKTNIIRVLYQMSRAYQYYSLTETSFSVNDFSIAAIQSTADSVLSLYVAAFENFGNQPANIRGKDINLLPYISKAAMNNFKKTKILHVTISPDEPSLLGYSNLLATKVALKLNGATGAAKKLQANITHEGRSLIFDQPGRAHVFSHVAITTPYELQEGRVVSDGAIAVDQDYVGVSPYGPWTIHVNSVDEAILDHLQGIALSFDGKARARA